jgi:hypothetical protein
VSGDASGFVGQSPGKKQAVRAAILFLPVQGKTTTVKTEISDV